MKLTVSRDELSSALQLVGRAVSSRPLSLSTMVCRDHAETELAPKAIHSMPNFP